MKGLFRRTALAILLLVPLAEVSSYRLLYREQLYELYHRHFVQTPERIAENVYWLEQALRSDFANPLNALATVENDREWEWYRYLFTMHINLQLTDMYLQWGAQYMKMEAYFYNAPWQRENLESLDRAEEYFRYARHYWEAAQRWSQEATEFRFVHLEEIQRWEDEHHRIRSGTLDYGGIIENHLDRVAEVRAAFESMDGDTY
ncbi:MAG: hypothetical protein PF508_13290 [Spirochaeta sp.]|jgi:hypothetical protein|nr:hypothetical protein [Spirochaeta sp.]